MGRKQPMDMGTWEHGLPCFLQVLAGPLLLNDPHDIKLAWSGILFISNPPPKSKISDLP